MKIKLLRKYKGSSESEIINVELKEAKDLVNRGVAEYATLNDITRRVLVRPIFKS